MDSSRHEEITGFRLHPEDLEVLARRVADLVRAQPLLGYVDTSSVARMLSVSEEWVRAHASELGAVRLGDGPRGTLRFDIEHVRDVLEARRSAARGGGSREPRARPRPTAVQLVPLPREAR